MSNIELLNFITLILITHFFADFFQPRRIANNKHKCFKTLLKHAFHYTSVFMAVYLIYFIFNFITLYPDYTIKSIILNETNYKYIICILFNGLAHLVVDFISSKATNKFHNQHKLMLFFSTIGFDQLTHTLIWLYSFYYIFITGVV